MQAYTEPKNPQDRPSLMPLALFCSFLHSNKQLLSYCLHNRSGFSHPLYALQEIRVCLLETKKLVKKLFNWITKVLSHKQAKKKSAQDKLWHHFWRFHIYKPHIHFTIFQESYSYSYCIFFNVSLSVYVCTHSEH